jgi:hypothetical protein
MFFAQDNHTIGRLSHTQRYRKKLLKSIEKLLKASGVSLPEPLQRILGCGAIRAVNLGGGGLLGFAPQPAAIRLLV